MKCDYCWKPVTKQFTEQTPSGMEVQRGFCAEHEHPPYPPARAISVNTARNIFHTLVRHYEDKGSLPNTADIDHSALLSRLLSGKEPLPKPPPLSHSYPHYSLGEGKETQIMDFTEWDGRICIDGDSDWVWEDKEKNLLRYPHTGDIYEYYQKSVLPITIRRDKTPYMGKFLKLAREMTIEDVIAELRRNNSDKTEEELQSYIKEWKSMTAWEVHSFLLRNDKHYQKYPHPKGWRYAVRP